MMGREERDRAIADAFEVGASRTELARRYGLTPRRISQIAASFGLHRYSEDQVAARLRNRGGRPRGSRLAAVLGDDFAHYCKLRRYMGAEYARNAMFGGEA